MTVATRPKPVGPGRQAPPWTQAMLAKLEDGEWHPMEELIRAGAPLVGPQRAVQWYRTGLGRKQKGIQMWKVKATDTHDQIRDGRRDGLRRIIAKLHRSGQIEIRNTSGKKWISGKEARLIR